MMNRNLVFYHLFNVSSPSGVSVIGGKFPSPPIVDASGSVGTLLNISIENSAFPTPLELSFQVIGCSMNYSREEQLVVPSTSELYNTSIPPSTATRGSLWSDWRPSNTIEDG